MRGYEGQEESYCEVDGDLLKGRALEGRDVPELRTDTVVTYLAMFKGSGTFS